MRNWRRNNPDKMKERNRRDQLMRFYGITLEEFNQLLADQDGRCAVCKTNSPKCWHVDHNHSTGKVRGILCRDCNIGIGMFSDDPEKIAAAAAYLRR